MVGVSPVNSRMVRETTPYNIVVTGDSSAGPDPIVGIYAQKLVCQGELEFGAVKFLANDKVIASNGGKGSWVLFDPDSGI